MSKQQQERLREYWRRKRLENPWIDFCIILKRLFNKPVVVTIDGEWKSGKTDFGLFLAVDMLLPLKVVSTVATNIQVDPNEERVKTLSDLVSLRYWLHKDNRKKVYVLDETTKHMYRRRAMSSKTVSFIELLSEVSKGHGRVIVITQDSKMIDKDISNPIFNRALFHKHGFYNRDKVTLISNSISGRRRVFEGIPPTTVKFNPYKEASFEEEKGHPLLSHPDVNLFYEWCINKEGMRKLAIKHKTNPSTVLRKIRRVAKVFVSLLPENAKEVTIGLEHDTESE